MSNLIDNIRLSDYTSATICKGRYIVKDKFNNIILDNHNLVVLKGRSFVIDKLWTYKNPSNELVMGIDNPTTVELNRIPLLFTVGSGGRQSTVDESVLSASPFVPTYADDNMKIPIVFNSSGSSNTYFTEGTLNGKVFDSCRKVENPETNETYMKMTMTVTGSETNNSTVNEIGLIIGSPTFTDGVLTNVTNMSLMTRATFLKDIPLTVDDYITIEYYIYG